MSFRQTMDELSGIFAEKRAGERAARRQSKRTPVPTAKRAAKPKKQRKRSKLAVPRWCITTEQLAILEDTFADVPSPSFSVREKLADRFGATARQVSIWFRNRRQKVRLQGMGGGGGGGSKRGRSGAPKGGGRKRAKKVVVPSEDEEEEDEDEQEEEPEEEDEEGVDPLEEEEEGEEEDEEEEGGSVESVVTEAGQVSIGIDGEITIDPDVDLTAIDDLLGAPEPPEKPAPVTRVQRAAEQRRPSPLPILPSSKASKPSPLNGPLNETTARSGLLQPAEMLMPRIPSLGALPTGLTRICQSALSTRTSSDPAASTTAAPPPPSASSSAPPFAAPPPVPIQRTASAPAATTSFALPNTGGSLLGSSLPNPTARDCGPPRANLPIASAKPLPATPAALTANLAMGTGPLWSAQVPWSVAPPLRPPASGLGSLAATRQASAPSVPQPSRASSCNALNDLLTMSRHVMQTSATGTGQPPVISGGQSSLMLSLLEGMQPASCCQTIVPPPPAAVSRSATITPVNGPTATAANTPSPHLAGTANHASCANPKMPFIELNSNAIANSIAKLTTDLTGAGSSTSSTTTLDPYIPRRAQRVRLYPDKRVYSGAAASPADAALAYFHTFASTTPSTSS